MGLRLTCALPRSVVRAPAPRRRARVAVLLASASLAGMALALRAFSSSTYRLGLGTVDVRVDAATHGQAELYVPLVDWGISAHAFSAPVAIRAEVRAVDRDSALVTLRSGADARQQLDDARAELPPVVRRAVRRALAVAIAGAIAGAASARCARGPHGPPAARARRPAGRERRGGGHARAGRAVAGARAPERVRASDVPRPRRRAAAAARVLGAARGRIQGLHGVVRDGAARPREPRVGDERDRPAGAGGTHEILVASDIHSNTLPLAAFGRYAEGKPIFLVGDFTELGTPYEDTVVHAVARSAGRSSPSPATTTRCR